MLEFEQKSDISMLLLENFELLPMEILGAKTLDRESVASEKHLEIFNQKCLEKGSPDIFINNFSPFPGIVNNWDGYDSQG